MIFSGMFFSVFASLSFDTVYSYILCVCECERERKRERTLILHFSFDLLFYKLWLEVNMLISVGIWEMIFLFNQNLL